MYGIEGFFFDIFDRRRRNHDQPHPFAPAPHQLQHQMIQIFVLAVIGVAAVQHQIPQHMLFRPCLITKG
jgi:hypothetical protein